MTGQQIFRSEGTRLERSGANVHATPEPDKHETRALMYKLLSVASRLLPDERVQRCSKYLVRGAESVVIKRNPADGKAWYHGVQHCSSIWNCPVCANRITEFRRKELTTALKDPRFNVIMVTYTLRHNISDRLSVLLAALKKAYKRSKSGRWYQTLQDEFGIAGSIRAIEVTYGDNGWHVHIHELMVLWNSVIPREDPEFRDSGVPSFEKPVNPMFRIKMAQLKTRLKRRWSDCLEKEKRDASWERGVDVNSRKDVSETYIAKLQLASELTRSINKTTRREGVTPFGMLDKIRQGEKQYEPLFQEYAAEFKGDRQLYWSHGLKDLLAVQDVEDDAITDEMVQDTPAEQFEDIAELHWDEWHKVCKADLRGELLKVASTDGRAGVVAFLDELWARGSPPK